MALNLLRLSFDHTRLAMPGRSIGLSWYSRDFPPVPFRKTTPRCVEPAPSEALFVEDRGFDLATYFRAAVEISADSFCFLNSYSEILAPGWLALMHRHLSQPGVGVVGASGNLISWYTSLGDRLGRNKNPCGVSWPDGSNSVAITESALSRNVSAVS